MVVWKVLFNEEANGKHNSGSEIAGPECIYDAYKTAVE
jgi:hypothetical protein